MPENRRAAGTLLRLRSRIVPLAELTGDDRARWRALADRAVEPNVGLDPDFLAPVLGWGDLGDDIRLVIVEDDDAFRAVLAVTVVRPKPWVPMRFVSTGGRFATAHAERHAPLLDPELTESALAALLEAVRTEVPGSLLGILAFPADGPVADALVRLESRGAVKVAERRSTANAYLSAPAGLGPASPPPGSPAIAASLATGHLSTARRRKLFQSVRALEREAGAALAVEDRSSAPDLVEQFLELQASGWKGDRDRGGAAMRFDAGHAGWFRDVVEGFRARGRLAAIAVTAGDELVVLNLVLDSGDAVFGFVDAYADRYRKHGPGNLGRLAAIEFARRADARFFDPGFGEDYASAAQWFPDRRSHRDLLLANGARARAALGAFETARRLRSARGGSAGTDGPVNDGA